MLTQIAALDALLEAHAVQLGGDLTPYRNHTYRVANLCAAQTSGGAQQLEKIAIAAAFHDLGIWTDGTFDYLQPSVRLAGAYLADTGKADWTPEIAEMILQHHKVSRYRSNPEWLVEPFRRADWADVTRGAITFELPRGLIRAVYACWPSAGFHRRLVQLELAHLRKHPLNPLPVFRL
jgi:predicted metal-dependent HD superfamily phosphohydrolase